MCIQTKLMCFKVLRRFKRKESMSVIRFCEEKKEDFKMKIRLLEIFSYNIQTVLEPNRMFRITY